MTDPLRKPPSLKPGDTVALVATSSPQIKGEERRIDSAIGFLRDLGLKVLCPVDPDERHFYLAGTDQARATRLSQVLHDPEVKAVFTTRGGYGASRMLPLLADNLQEIPPKIVVGLSDVTSLLLHLERNAQLVVFHGPCLATTAFQDSSEKEISQKHLQHVLFEPDYLPKAELSFLKPGSAQGPVTGGCLSLVAASLGTPYEVQCAERILFLEDVNEAPFRIDRMLTQLRNAGKFKNLRAVVFGRMEDCWGRDQLLWKMLEDFFREDPFPVAYGLNSGHGPCSLTLPLGCQARLDQEQDKLIWLESGTV